MRVLVNVDGALSRFAGILAAIPAKARKAMADGLNEGGDLQRTKVRRDLKDQTGVSRYGAIVKRTGAKRAGPGSLEYQIRGERGGMPVKEFPVKARVGAPVTATLWNVAHNFGPRSFKSSRRGLLKRRVGAARMPIEGFNGPSVAKEIVKDQTAAHFTATAGPTVERAVLKRLGSLL